MMRFQLRRCVITIAVLSVATLGLSACGKPHDSSTSTNGASHLPSATPAATKDVDEVRWNLSGGEPASLDAAKVFSGSDLQVESNMCESLLTLNSANEIKPGLATAVDKVSAVKYIVHVRSGVKFTDGKPLTADDVAFSLNRTRDPKRGSYWGSFASNVSSVTASDANTVVIEMSSPDAIFYRMLTTPVGQVIERAYAEQAGDNYGTAAGGVMCTGPYVLSKWDQGNRITLDANTKWWNLSSQPLRAKKLIFSFLTDDSTITSALVNGDLDGTDDLSSSTLSKLLNAKNGQVLVGPSTRQLAVVPTHMSGSSPLANPKIREAFAKSIDYAGLFATSLSTLYQPLRVIAPPGAWGYSKNIYQTAYDKFKDPARDVEGAKKLLTEAGNTKPKIILEIPADIPQYVTIGESIQSNAKDAGFDVQLKPLTGAASSAMYTDAKARDSVDAFLTDYFADIPDPVELYMQIGTPDGASNFNHYDNPSVAKLLNEARGTLDDTKRAELAVEAQAAMTKELVWIQLAYPQQSLFVNNRLGGATASFPSNLYSPWFAPIGGR